MTGQRVAGPDADELRRTAQQLTANAADLRDLAEHASTCAARDEQEAAQLEDLAAALPPPVVKGAASAPTGRSPRP